MDPAGQSYQFGAFRFGTAPPDLTRDGASLPAGSRACAILAALLARPGDLVTKDELIEAVWPGQFVEESNLTVQISQLRQLLGDTEKPHRWIATIPGRGYRFAGSLEADQPAIIGRDAELASLHAAVTRHALVTVTGAGGMGKTTLVKAFAREFGATSPPIFLALETLLGAGQATDRLAQLLHVSPAESGDAARAVAEHLRHTPKFIIFDNCEHVSAEIAALAGAILARAPRVKILATSRAALDVPGEFLLRLPPLTVPPPGQPLSAADCLDFSATRLFAERAAAHLPLDDANAAAIADICRRLDGIPLAIELAASRLRQMPLAALQTGLARQFRLLAGDPATRPPRQRTMEATIAWSHGLLADDEQIFFRRLGVFAGSFSRQAARDVAGWPPLAPERADHLLDRLLDQSLVTLGEARGNIQRYRLLESTKAYALQNLTPAEETRCRLRLLDYLASLYHTAMIDNRTMATEMFLDLYAPDWDNARAAMDWVFGTHAASPAAVPREAILPGQRLVACSDTIALELQMRRLTLPLAAAIARIDAGTPPDIVVQLRGCQLVDQGHGGVERGRIAREAVEISRNLADKAILGNALVNLGITLFGTDDPQAEACIAEAETHLRAAGALRPLATCLGFQSHCRMMAGDLPAAREKAEACLAQATAIGCTRIEMECRAHLAAIEFFAGRMAQAVSLCRAVIASSRQAGVHRVTFHTGWRLALIHTKSADFAAARQVLADVLPFYAGNLADLTNVITEVAYVIAQSDPAAAARFSGFRTALDLRLGIGTEADPEAERSQAKTSEILTAALAPEVLARLQEEGAAWNEDQALAAARDAIG
jgi:predicted ATPase